MKLTKIRLFVLLLIVPLTTLAQLTYPVNDGDKVRYSLQAEIRDSYLSGICIVIKNDGTIASSIVNEFGISLIDFTYSERKDKVRILSVIKPLDRWYIKYHLKRSLKGLLKTMKAGNTEYIDAKNGIRYFLTLNNET